MSSVRAAAIRQLVGQEVAQLPGGFPGPAEQIRLPPDLIGSSDPSTRVHRRA